MSPDDLTRIVGAFGRIRLGPGVVGKITYIGLGAFVVFAILAFRVSGTDRLLVLTVLGVAFLSLILVLAAILFFSLKNPGAALLEGAELLRWQEIEHATKEAGPLPPRAVIPDPRGLPSHADDETED